ncbi:MAG TPA: tetratricopeptide repeat protein, partial [Gemmatimonadaceae bacterium]
MSDEIRRLSEELARDPSSLVFLQLGEALRRAGQLDLGLKVAHRGLERHAHNADAHDLLARIRVDRGELQDAFDEWDMVLRLAPSHVGARKGMGYVLFKQGKLAEAEEHLSTAATHDRDDASIATALRMVRRLLRYARVAGNGHGAPDHAELLAAQRRVEEEARLLFADILGEGEHTALLLNADGLVAAGLYVTADGEDVSQEVGAALTGVRDEALRAVRHLDLGTWKAVVYETDLATVAKSVSYTTAFHVPRSRCRTARSAS